MKYFLTMIILVSCLIAGRVTEQETRKAIQLTNVDLITVKLDFTRALRIQKMSRQYRYYMDYDPTFMPFILVVNSLGYDIKPSKHNYGQYYYKNIDSLVYYSSKIHKVYSQKQINYFMSNEFKVFRFYRDGIAVYIIRN